MKVSQDVKERFFSKVEIPEDQTECWIWTGSIGGGRYGGFNFNGVTTLAHRMSWMIYYGKIPKGAYICHHCDNTKCVNPKHLFLGDQFANMADMVKKGRAKGGGVKGEQNFQAKLTTDSAYLIKRLIEEKVQGTQIAKFFGVHKATISDIKTGKNWKHVTI